ncbi:MAG: arsenosugar biosynthesis radical SAM protein ArsS [Deltaproteobacteria bacterium]|nr:arsenosugar biosynthesis radical SAM protein ArsS [Deltaproteobacteria bacterium]
MSKTRLETESAEVPPFSLNLIHHGLKLLRSETHTIQINMGLLCNQACHHCHLSAGPGRTELLDGQTAQQIVDYVSRNRFETADITGGAPELNPVLADFIKQLSPHVDKTMLRCNLTAFTDENHIPLRNVILDNRVIIVASMPSINELQADAQRGRGTFKKSLDALKMLNEMGYGHDGTSLELNLVSNPTGAFLPANQDQAEKRFHQILKKKFGITFTNLFSFGNVPLGRFKQWLNQSGNYQNYLRKLQSAFNPCAIDGLMCRSLVSISWDGYLYDCDFNLAAGLHMGGKKIHISQMTGPPEPGKPIAVGQHCYTCTAGAGFT